MTSFYNCLPHHDNLSRELRVLIDREQKNYSIRKDTGDTKMTRTTKSLVKVLVLAVVLSSTASAGNEKVSELSGKAKAMTANLLTGIKSQNDGLRKSSIYYAGKYKVDEAVETLTEQLDKEKDPATRILIALSLYSIGSPEGMNAVGNRVNTDSNAKVRRMCAEIYGTYKMNNVKELLTAQTR